MAAEKSREKSKVVNRFIIFVVRNVIILSVIAAVLMMAFFITMDISNLRVLINDGMTRRVESILTPSEVDEDSLGQYFTREFIINSDKALKEKYKEYNINNGFITKVEIDRLWCWPWQMTTTATVTETVTDIRGSLVAGKQGNTEAQTPPQWDKAKYKVYFKKVNSAWKIDAVELIEVLEAKATPTKNMVYETPNRTSVKPTPKPSTTPNKNDRIGTVTTQGGNINFRVEPKSSATIISQLTNGTQVIILGEEDGWYKIEVDGKKGYASKDFIKEN